jgi:hypothetical protein
MNGASREIPEQLGLPGNQTEVAMVHPVTFCIQITNADPAPPISLGAGLTCGSALIR